MQCLQFVLLARIWPWRKPRRAVAADVAVQAVAQRRAAAQEHRAVVAAERAARVAVVDSKLPRSR